MWYASQHMHTYAREHLFSSLRSERNHAIDGAEAQRRAAHERNMHIHGCRCDEQLREYLPRQRELRVQLQPLLSTQDRAGHLLPLPGEPEFQVQPGAPGTLSEACRLYRRVGCAAPAMGFLLVNGNDDLERWRDVIEQRQKHLNYSISAVRSHAQAGS